MCQRPWDAIYCLITYLLCLKVVGHDFQHVWAFFNGFSHISRVFSASGTNSRVSGLSSMALSHILLLLKQSGICSKASDSSSMALSHICRALKWSGTHANESGFMCTVSLDVSCVLRWLENAIIQLTMFIYTLAGLVRSKHALGRCFSYQIIF